MSQKHDTPRISFFQKTLTFLAIILEKRYSENRSKDQLSLVFRPVFRHNPHPSAEGAREGERGGGYDGAGSARILISGGVMFFDILEEGSGEDEILATQTELIYSV